MSFPALPYYTLPGHAPGGGTCDYPAEDDVRDGVGYAFTTMTGNVTLPSAGNVVAGVDYGAGGDEFTGTFECPVSPVPPPDPTAATDTPFANISARIVARVAAALGTTTDWVRPAANDDYVLTEFENLFAVIRAYGPSPVDPTTGASYPNDGAGRYRRVVGRRVRIYIYTRSGVDTPGGDEVALQGADSAQVVTTPPTMPGQYVAEESVLNALDDWTPTYVDALSVTRPVTIGPVHWVDSADGPPERRAEDEDGIVRSHLDFQVVYTLSVQKVDPAPAGLPTPNMGN